MKTKSVAKVLSHDGGFESETHHLRAAQIWQLYSQSRVGLIGALLGALILVATLWNVVSHLVLVVWIGSYALVQVARHTLISAFHRRSPSGDATFPWGVRFAVGTFLSALLWGLAGFFLYPANSLLHQFVLAIFVAGIISAAAVVYSPTTECYLPTILAGLLPLAARHIYDWDEIHLITGAVIVLFAIVLTLTASRMHGFVVESLRLRFEKDNLVKSLQEARGDLEMRVEERSAELKRTNENLVAEIAERVRTEKALRESEEKYRSLAELLPQFVYEVDEKGFFTFVNRSALEATGYTQEDVDKGLNALDVFIPDEAERLADNISRSLGGENIPGSEYTLLRKDGSTMRILVYARPIVHDEKIVGLRGVGVDISDRKLAEEALRDSEENYRSVVENMQDVFYRTDMEGTITMVSPSGPAMIGYELDEIIGLNVARGFYKNPGERDRLLATLREKGKVANYEVELVRKDGRSIIVSTNSHVRYDNSGKPMGVEGVFTDITERKRAEKALRASEARYRRLFEAAKDGILILDADTAQVVDVNQFLIDLLDYPIEEFLEKKLWDVGMFDDIAKCRAVFAELQSNEYTRYEDLPLRTRVGEYVEVEFVSNVYLVDGCKVIQCNIRDITDRKRLEKQLLQAQKMEAIGTLAGGIAHDFNNLLTVVMGFSELLLAEKNKKHPEYTDLQKIFHAGKNGAELVKRLLMFSRKAEPKPVPMNLNKQIVQVEKLLRRTIPRMIDIDLNLSPDLPAINADPSQVEQVLMNLAVNASDAMPDVGKLTVRTSVVRLDEEYCRLHLDATPGEYVFLEVVDTGHGMDKETVEHIFEPFFTTKEVGRGTGLGLAMVYGIVKQHNGHINVYSEVGTGTTFRVYLPTILADEEPDAEDSGIMPAFGTETVLLVDDEEFVRELGARILTKQGYTVLQAENGREALELFREKRSQIALVILDLIMPEMGGAECLKELLKIDPKVRVLVASGFSADASVKETLQMGAKGFVSKPFRVKELLGDVRKVLDNG